MLRVTVWNENKHEQEYEGIRKVYPKGIHGCIAEFLEKEEDFVVRTATFFEPEHGLTEEVLSLCDKTIRIPMTERCESLNAAIAAAVLLWEAYR